MVKVSLNVAPEGSQKYSTARFDLDLTDDSWYAIMKDLVEMQRDNLGWKTRCRKRQGRKIEEDAYLVVFGREFQSAGFKWLKKDFCSQTVNG